MKGMQTGRICLIFEYGYGDSHLSISVLIYFVEQSRIEDRLSVGLGAMNQKKPRSGADLAEVRGR